MSGFTPRSRTVTLYGGDYQERLTALEAKVEAAKRDLEPRMLSEVPPEVALTEEYNALVAEAASEGAVIRVTIKALPRKQWRALVDAHPPREGNEDDKELGVNDESFSEAIVPPSIASISDPDLTVDGLLEVVSDAQFMLLLAVTFELNRRTGPDPKERLSLPIPTSGETSE